MRHALPADPPRDRPFDVVGLGENSVDQIAVLERYPAPGGKVRILHQERQGGGQVATAMVACRRLGLSAAYLGKVGDDDAGALSRASLAEEGVDVSGLLTEPGARSRFAVVLIDHASGDRTVLYDQDSRLALRPGELDAARVTSARVLHVDATDLPTAIEAARIAREAGMPVVIDVDQAARGVDDLLRLASACIVPGELACTLAGTSDRPRALRALATRTDGFCCLTLGADGCAALVDGEVLALPAYRVEAIDTTACGDVFHAGFIAALLRGLDAVSCLRYAQAAAAMKARALGGRPGIPRHDDVLAFLAERSERLILR